MTSLFMAPAPPTKDEVACGGCLALPKTPNVVELGFIFRGSENVFKDGSRLGESPSSSPLGVPATDESSEYGDACSESSRVPSDTLSGVAGTEPEPLIVTDGEM